MAKITEMVEKLVSPLALERNDRVVDVEYVKEKKQYYLRIYVDREPDGIDIEEIANLSEIVSEKLDSLSPDPFPDPFVLELSSPGLERFIKNEDDWNKAKNSYVHLSLYKKIEKNKEYDGTLKDFDDDKILLEIKVKTRRKVIEISRNLIASIRFAIEF